MDTLSLNCNYLRYQCIIYFLTEIEYCLCIFTDNVEENGRNTKHFGSPPRPYPRYIPATSVLEYQKIKVNLLRPNVCFK